MQALAAADSRLGFCAPNPAVGAVLVSASGDLLSVGCHWACGYDHAEVDAIKKAGKQSDGATLYVTLEPCNHTGKTPPCTRAIIDASIARVYYGYKDPNLRVLGSGAEVLTASGISCEYLPSDAVHVFYRSYTHWLKTGLPRFIAKLAQSKNGVSAKGDGRSLTITGPEAAAHTAKGRKHADAILTTVTTVLADDPRLNCRLTDRVESRPVYVLDSCLRFPTKARLLQTAQEVILVCRDDASMDEKNWPCSHLRCLPVPYDERGLNWSSVARILGAEGLHEVWVEVGPTAFQSLLESGLLSEAIIYQSTNVVEIGLPGIALSHKMLVNAEYEERNLGDDVMYHFRW